MLNQKMLVLLIGACAFLLAAEPAAAQKGVLGAGAGVGSGEWAPNVPPGSLVDAPANTAITRDNTSGSRLHRQREEERRQAERRRRALRGEAIAPITNNPAQIRAAAQSVASAAGLDCQVTAASHPGVDANEAPIYEAACAEGQGYLLIASTPAQSFGCFELEGSAALARLDNPAAEVGQLCELPSNQNSLPLIGGWAREAGVSCQVDRAVLVGRSVGSNPIYEIGCADADGYWLEKAGEGWVLQRCAQIVASGETCRFSARRDQSSAG
ncbi:hypothetical protein [Brevundimonas sp.]|uniref:hypothetical protein n=1 Tax=Brevundimonas sp. TaxID=1871086 RepID=UPI002FC8B639